MFLRYAGGDPEDEGLTAERRAFREEVRLRAGQRFTAGEETAVIAKDLRVTFALQPHRAETFKLSKDPSFIDKVRDGVGLHLDPPERALVLCVNEESQIQALDRSQPVLPMMTGVSERCSHDYVRAGITTLSATLDTQTGLARLDRPADAPQLLARQVGRVDLARRQSVHCGAGRGCAVRPGWK